MRVDIHITFEGRLTVSRSTDSELNPKAKEEKNTRKRQVYARPDRFCFIVGFQPVTLGAVPYAQPPRFKVDAYGLESLALQQRRADTHVLFMPHD